MSNGNELNKICKEIKDHIDKSTELVKNKKFQQAYDLLLPYVNMIRNGEISQYIDGKKTYNFSQLFEFILYCNLCAEKKEESFLNYESPISEILLCCGSILYDLQRYDEAVDVLTLARQWAPINVMIGCELAENYKRLSKIDEFYDLNKELLNYCFNRHDIARIYRNFGWYFAEKKLWKEAIICEKLSLAFEENDHAILELRYILDSSNLTVDDKLIDAIPDFLREYLLPLTVFNEDVFAIACSTAKNCQKEEDGSLSPIALYCYVVAYNMTFNEEIKQILIDNGVDFSDSEELTPIPLPM